MNEVLQSKKAARVLALILVGYVLVFFWLACRKLEAGTGQSGDSALLDNVFYETLHGKFFWCFDLDNSYFESHQEPLLILFTPLYVLWPHVQTLLLLQTVCIAVASIPVFLIGCSVLADEWAALLMTVAFLFFPTLVSQHVNQIHTSLFPLPLLLFAFYFFQQQRLVPFAVTLALACFGKEITSVTAFMFAPYALWRRRDWRWTVVSAVIPASILFLAIGVMHPYFARGKVYIHAKYFSQFGESFGEIARNIILDPVKVVDALSTSQNMFFLVLLLSGVAWFLPFFAAETIFALPELFLNLISGNDGMKVTAWHYNVNVGAFLVIGTLYALPRIDRWIAKRAGGGNYRLTLAAIVAVLSVSTWWQWFNPRDFTLLPWHDARQRAMDLVPPNDSLLVGPEQILALMARRDVVTTPNRLEKKPEQASLYNWVLFDMNYRVPAPGSSVPIDLLKAYGANAEYALVFTDQNVFVFHRLQPYPPEKVPPIRIW